MVTASVNNTCVFPRHHKGQPCRHPDRSVTGLSATLFAALLIALSGPTSAHNIYSYRAPDGTLLLTDQPQARVGPQHELLSVRKAWVFKGGALNAATKNQYDELILSAAQRHAVDAALIKAVIHAESSFDNYAVSAAGAQGLMQLMPPTAAFMQVSNVFDAWDNINGGTAYLAYLKQRFDQLDLILAAYNAGEGHVRRYGGIPPFAETQNYVLKVMQLKQQYARQFHQ